MNEHLKIYLLSPSLEIFRHIADFADRFGHTVIGRTGYLQDCLYDVNENPPDVIICSLNLRDIDTPSALKILHTNNNLSKCAIVPIRLSFESSPNIIDAAVVPFDLYSFELFLRSKVEDRRKNRQSILFTPRQRERNKVITSLLHTLGMSSDLEGYQMIHKALNIILDNPGCFKNLSKTVYPEIGKAYEKNGKYAERMIQSAIMSSWLKCPLDARQQIFGNSIDEYPSNKVYLATLAEYITNEYDLL